VNPVIPENPARRYGNDKRGSLWTLYYYNFPDRFPFFRVSLFFQTEEQCRFSADFVLGEKAL